MFECFKETYKKPETKMTQVVDKFSTKIAVIVGHNAKSQGATNYLKESEYVFNSRIALKMQEKCALLGIELVILKRPSGLSYKDQCRAVAKQVKALSISYTIELHFNAASSKALGCEVLVDATHSNYDDKIADYITDQLNELYGFKERHEDGVKTVTPEHDGHGMLEAVKNAGAVSVLVEPCFAHYRNAESALIFEQEDKYVDVLVGTCLQICKGLIFK